MRQSLFVRAEMLKPIEAWVQGADRIVSMMGDTISSVEFGTPQPLFYSVEERRKAAQYFSENTNVVLAILWSKVLVTNSTEAHADKLAKVVTALDVQIRRVILPLATEAEAHRPGQVFNDEYRKRVIAATAEVRANVQAAHVLIAKIKTALN